MVPKYNIIYCYFWDKLSFNKIFTGKIMIFLFVNKHYLQRPFHKKKTTVKQPLPIDAPQI